MSKENQTDEEIIFSYKNGDSDLFKVLIDRYNNSVYNFSVRFVGTNNAPDITQEVFIKIWKNIREFDISKSSFKTWLFIITKNTVIDFLKKKRIINFSELDKIENEYIFSENIRDQNMLPDEILQKLQDINLLNKLLDKLSINYKTILILHYQEEMTFEEIGKVLGKPLNTVKSYHYRAILELRKGIN